MHPSDYGGIFRLGLGLGLGIGVAVGVGVRGEG